MLLSCAQLLGIDEVRVSEDAGSEGCGDTSSSVQNCGACGNDCTALDHVLASGVSCVRGACVIDSNGCAPGHDDCNDTVSDGCEADLATAETCGDCSTTCPPTAPICAPAGSGGRECASTCEAPQVPCDTTCADLDRDPANCGACGHDCGGGECMAGACQPVLVAGSLDRPYSMAVAPESGQVFWLTPTELLRCPLAGCERPTRLAEFAEYLTMRKLDNIVATEQDVFWLGNKPPAWLMRCPAAGCTFSAPEAPDGFELDTPRSLARDGDLIVVGERFSIRTCQAQGGCTLNGCVSADSMQSAAIDDTSVFWLESTDPAGLYSCPRDGTGTPLRLTADRGLSVRLHDGSLFVLKSAGDGIYRCSKDGCGGQGADVVTGEEGINSLAVDARGVYWTTLGSTTEATGTVKTCPLAGCDSQGPRVLATGQAQPIQVHVFGDDVLWVEQGLGAATPSGAIKRVRL
jgi:hypothetical protein